MPNIPFRVAFWALCVAFAMLVTLSVINPSNMRANAYAQRSKPVAIPDWKSVEQAPEPTLFAEAEPTLAPEYASSTMQVAKLEPDPEPTLAQPEVPIMVTSAHGDFRRDVGGLYPVEEDRKTVMVPEPHDLEMNSFADIAPPVPNEVVAAPTIPEYATDEPTGVLLQQMASIQSDLASLKAVALNTPGLSTLTVEDERNFFISESDQKGRWTFEFQETELRDALRALGEQIGWTVVVASGVEGTVNSEFIDVDPEQAFAVLVKSNHCSVSRRGDYILIDQR